MNKVITTQGNVQFQFPDGKIVNVHPNHIYTVYNEDTVSFILVALPKSSGLSTMTSKAEDLELNGTVYSFAELPNAVSEAFAIAGAQARCEIVDELPESGYTNTIYLVPQPAPQTGFDEYVYILDQGWELIGDTSIEMDKYVLKTVFSGYTADTAVVLNGLRTDVDTTSGNVITETERALLAESGLSDAIDAEETARETADGVISGAVDTVSSGLTEEAQRAQNAESGLSDAIDVVSGALDTHIQDEVRHISGAERTSWNEKTKTISLTQAEYDVLPSSAKTDATKLYVISDAQPIDLSVYAKVSALTEEISARTDADTALDNKIGVVSGNVETETTRAEGVENVLSGAIDTLGVRFFDDAKYEDSGNTKVINFYNGNTIKATIDCSDFIVDGMVDDVRIENGYLVIDFNTESGKQDIQIPLTDIFNPNNYYTKSETSGATEIATALNTKLDATAYTPTDLSNYYQKSETSGATEIATALAEKLAISDFNAYSGTIETALSGKADTATTYTKTEVDNAITAATSTKQDTLVSSENIKTINNESILGSGNITIQGGGGTVESAITSGSTNAVESKAIWSAVTYDVSINETLEFDNTYAATNYPSGCNSVTFENSNGAYLPTGDYVFTSGGSEVAKLTCTVISWWPYEASWTSSDPKLTYASEGYSAVTASYSELAGDIDGVTVPSAFTSAYTATASGENHLWINENTYRKDEVYNKSEINVLSGIVDTKLDTISGAVDTKLDATAYTPTVVDSALDVASTNPVQNQALYSELRLSDGVETTLTFEGHYTTNYPNGCTKIKVEDITSMSQNTIIFQNDGGVVGNIIVSNWGSMSVNTNDFQGASYEISGSTVIISYPSVTTVTELNVGENPKYTYKAITSSTTPLKDQVTANTAALGGMKLQQISQSDYESLQTKDSSTLYIII